MTVTGQIRILPLCQVGLVAAAVVVIYWESFSGMAALWAKSSYRHSALVLPIVFLLLWRKSPDLLLQRLRPWFWGLPLLVLTVFAWIMSKLTGVQLLEHMTIVGMVVVATVTFLGIAFSRAALFPLLFLFMAVPIGDEFVPSLMQITADGSAFLLRLTGVAVYREGLFMSLPGGTFEIAEVCSGLRFFTAGLMISLLYSYFTYQSSLKRVLFVAVTCISMVFANILRAYIVMVIASATELQVFAGRDHVYFGWFLFAVVITSLFILGAKYGDQTKAEGDSLPVSAITAGLDSQLGFALILGLLMVAITAQPYEAQIGSSWILLVLAGIVLLYVLSHRRHLPRIARESIGYAKYSMRRVYGTVIIVAGIAILIGGPVFGSRDYEKVENFADQISLPTVPGCTGPIEWRPTWRPKINKPDGVWLASYDCGASIVNVFVGGYVDTMQGKELVGRSSQLFPANWGRFSSVSTKQVQLDRIGNLAVNELEYKNRGGLLISWFWYSVGGHPTTSPIVVKIYQGWRALTGKPRYAFVTVLALSGSTDVDKNREILRQFSAALVARNANQLAYAADRTR